MDHPNICNWEDCDKLDQPVKADGFALTVDGGRWRMDCWEGDFHQSIPGTGDWRRLRDPALMHMYNVFMAAGVDPAPVVRLRDFFSNGR